MFASSAPGRYNGRTMNLVYATPPEALDRYRGVLDAAIKALAPREPRGLYDMLRYHLGWADQAGQEVEGGSTGKALRPTLCFLTAEALGCPWPRAVTAAAALELVHNFSLIHDDIQDGDTERRGRPTVWSLWGVGQALWAGNAMRVLSDRALTSDGLPSAKGRQAARLLTQAYLEIIEGQYLDLEFERRTDIGVASYLDMISRKTGALIRCAVELGALVATDDSEATGALCAWGSHLGQAFQVRDDILGIWGNPALTGKPVGNDIRRKKKTFPVIHGFQHATGAALAALKAAYGPLAAGEEQVEEVLGALEETGAYREAQSLVERETGQAIEALGGVKTPLSPTAREQMVQLTTFLAHRDR
ncbi:MAG: polyprenyl synthetase family protein [Chloroflexi bacterium]|nr:polyprenyl synthetase family protein [Chloroflexota bacterium]